MKKLFSLLALMLLYTFELCCQIQTYPADSANIQFRKQIDEAKSNKTLLSKAYYDYGVFLDEKGDVEASLMHLKKSISYAMDANDDLLIARIGNYLGSVYWIEGDCHNSTKYYEQALVGALHIDDSEMISTIKMNLSGNYSSAGKTEKGIRYALDALAIKEKQNNKEGLCYDYIMIAEIFQSINNMDKWKEYVDKAYRLKDTESCAQLSDEVMIYNNLGRIAEAEKAFEMALAYYDTIVQISKPAEYDQGIGIALLNSALILQMQEKYKEALDYANQSESYFGDVPYFLMAMNNVKSELLHKLGNSSEALELVENNYANENMELYPKLKQDCLDMLYEINYQLGNYQKAHSWNDSLWVYDAKVREDESKSLVEELETKYETEKKEQQIVLLSAENKIKNQRIILFIVVSVLLLMLLAVGVLLYYRNKRKNQQKQEVLRQQLLRSQMNPHFLFNALGSIQNYMLNNDAKEAAGYLNNFASLTRSILDHSAMETVMLEDELKALKNYIVLEQMRLQHSFKYVIEYDDYLETEFINIPPMLIQPFVENAIKHGLRNVDKGGELKLTIEDKEEFLKVCVVDNGVGFDENTRSSSTHKSMAMSIFKQRIGLLNKKLSKKADFEIKSTPEKGTTVVINLPILN